MIEHADDQRDDPEPVDVCVVGAGAAGITLALDLARAGVSVIVLEGGGREFDARSAALYQGENVGLPLRFNTAEMSLDSVRLRQLGGSTNHWSGMCHPLDDHDFEARPHLPWSGWPIAAADLAPHYVRAQETCELGDASWQAEPWFERTFRVGPLAAGTAVHPVVYRLGPPTRFGEHYAPELGNASGIRVLLGANAVNVRNGGGRVTGVDVRTLAGNGFTVRCDRYVLATGGLEVPRLLLSSTDSGPAGLGNEHDLVGRTFMEHPHFVGGRILLAGSGAELAPYQILRWTRGDLEYRTWVGFALDAGTQEELGIGNAAVFGWRDDGERAVGDGRLAQDVEQAGSLVTDAPGASIYSALIRTESRPDPESRVVLGDDVDALGMRRIRLDWRVGGFEWETARGTLDHLARALGATGTGRVEVDPGGVAFADRARLEIGNHHMGTARMSTDPADGVVDPDCRVHSVENLYVAGSAVFPTVGAANPTLTVVALAHRLADHLAGRP